MRIVFTCNNLATGGAERVLCSLANRLAEEGNEIKIICYCILPSFYYEISPNITVLELDQEKNTRKGKIKRHLASIRNLQRLITSVQGADIIVSFYSVQNCLSIIAGRINKIPVICCERDPFFLNDGKVMHMTRRLLYPKAKGFIHQTTFARDYLRKNEGVSCDDIIIQNPIWITDYPVRRPIHGRVISVGRLDKNKNFDGLIEAFEIVTKTNPAVELLIYGDGPERDHLLQMINEKKLNSKVVLMGISHNIVDCLIEADVFVLFSKGEGYPNTLMEALAVGVPSISSDCPVGGPRDMINNGENGFLVSNGNVEELAEKISILINDETLKKKFSLNAVKIRETNKFETVYSKFWNYFIRVSG